MDVENDIAKLGVGINYMVLPKLTLGAGLMITPFETDGDYEIMYNRIDKTIIRFFICVYFGKDP